jgi:hypothetical protein
MGGAWSLIGHGIRPHAYGIDGGRKKRTQKNVKNRHMNELFLPDRAPGGARGLWRRFARGAAARNVARKCTTTGREFQFRLKATKEI